MIETKIQELTEAIRQLTVSLNSMRSVAPATVSAPAAPVVTKPTPASITPPPPAPAPSTEEAEEEEAPLELPTPNKVTQADLRDVASKLLEQKKLPEILRINREHGIRRITECPEEKYESVYAALSAALNDGSKS